MINLRLIYDQAFCFMRIRVREMTWLPFLLNQKYNASEQVVLDRQSVGLDLPLRKMKAFLDKLWT